MRSSINFGNNPEKSQVVVDFDEIFARVSPKEGQGEASSELPPERESHADVARKKAMALLAGGGILKFH